jgi:hypothetical protein
LSSNFRKDVSLRAAHVLTITRPMGWRSVGLNVAVLGSNNPVSVLSLHTVHVSLHITESYHVSQGSPRRAQIKRRRVHTLGVGVAGTEQI